MSLRSPRRRSSSLNCNQMSQNNSKQDEYFADKTEEETLNLEEHSQFHTPSLHKYRMLTSLDDFRSLSFWRAVIAEFIGTLILVLIAVGSTVQGWEKDTLDIVQISLSFGLCVATSVWIIGHISGGHINPAVTMAMLVTRKISLIRAILFIIVQCLGAISGAGLLFIFTPAEQRGSLGCTTLNKGVNSGMGCGIELFITAVLILTVFAACDKNRKDLGGSFPLTIGLAVTLGHLWAAEFTGSSMNPARSLGTAVIMDIWTDHWVYWVGPIAGGVLGGLLYDHVLTPNASMMKVRDCLMSADFDDSDYKSRKTKIVTIINEDEEDDLHDSETSNV